jgi:AcrR family transcriptional regulator
VNADVKPASRSRSSHPQGGTLSEILDAAEIEFERHGFARVTMSDIASAAGVSRPTVYRAFGDRTRLIDAIVERRASRIASKLDHRLESTSKFVDRLVEGTCLIIEAGRSDELIGQLLRSGGGRYSDDDLPIDFLARVWGPVFEQARSTGELRSDLRDEEALRWLGLVTVGFIRWPVCRGGDDGERSRLLREYLLPGFEA